MAEARVGSWLLVIFYAIIRTFSILWALVSRVFIVFFTTLWAFLLALWAQKILVASLILIFGAGLPSQIFQEEIMTAVDVTYECGFYPGIQIGGNAIAPVIRIPYELGSVEWNNLILSLVEDIDSLFAGLRMLESANKILGARDGLGVISLALFDEEFDTFKDIFNDVIKEIAGYFEGWWVAIKYTVPVIVDIFNSLFIRADAFGASCSLCAADPTPRCTLRETAGASNGYDCDACHEHTANLFGIIGAFLDALTGNFVADLSDGDTSFLRVFRATGALTRSTYMIALQMIDASIRLAVDPCLTDLEIYNIGDEKALITLWFVGGDVLVYDCGIGGSDAASCCGKPSGCAYPSGITGTRGTDLPVGIVPCIGELFMALTSDAFDDWLFIVLGFLAEIVAQVITTVDRSIVCANPPPTASTGFITISECFDNFATQSGTAGVDAGVCNYESGNAAPTGGIHQCFGMILTCLEFDAENRAPLLKPLIDADLLQFFLVDLFRYTVDFAACPFITLGNCLECSACTYSEFVDKFNYLKTCSPLWWDALGWLAVTLQWFQDNIIAVINTLTAQINGLVSTFSNLGECLSPCDIDDVIIEGSFLECFAGNEEACTEDELPTSRDERPAFARFRDQRRRRPTGTRAGDEVPDATRLQRWRESLIPWGITPGSFCGDVLYSSTPQLILDENWGEYVTFTACYRMFQTRRATEDACDVPHGTKDGLRDVLSDIATTLARCDAEGLAVITHKRPRNSTTPIPASTSAVGGGVINMAKMRMPAYLSAINVSVFARFVPTFASRVVAEVKTTRLYGRTVEFYTEYSARLGLGDSGSGSGNDELSAAAAAARQADLDGIYAAFANDVVNFYHWREFRNETALAASAGALAAGRDELPPGKFVSKATGAVLSYMTPASIASTRERALRKMEQLGFVEPANAPQRVLHAAMDPEMLAQWSAINGALRIEYKPWFQFAAGALRALRTRDGSNLVGMLRGSVRYAVSTGEFMPDARFRAHAARAEANVRPTLLDTLPQSRLMQMAAGDTVTQAVNAVNKARGGSSFDLRKSRSYRPFPVPSSGEGETLWITKETATLGNQTWAHLTRAHARYDGRRKETLEKRSATAKLGVFDANQILYDTIDWFVALFSVSGGDRLVNSLVDNTKEFWGAFDVQNYTETTVVERILKFFSCSIPENIDGTEPHSPFCVFLFREDALTMISGVTQTEGAFPPQLPWPEELVVQDCVSTYSGTGADEIFNFAFSNNCNLVPAKLHVSMCATGTCAGTVELEVAEINAYRSVYAYTFSQSGAECALAVAAIPTAACAAVEKVRSRLVVDGVETGDACVRGWSAGSAADTTSGCSPGLTAATADVLRLEFSEDMPVNSVCRANVTFNRPVDFNALSERVVVAGSGDAACSNCSLRGPTATCLPNNFGLRDPWRARRPFCDTCDYCEREYQSCAAAGFGDILDTLLYITGNIPRVGDDLIFSGIPVSVIEQWIGVIAVISGLLVAIPLLIVCCVGIPMWALVINAQHFLTWILFVFFGGLLPYPALFFSIQTWLFGAKPPAEQLAFMGVVVLVSPGIDFGARLLIIALIVVSQFESLDIFMKIVLGVLGLIFAIWLLTLAFTFPRLTDVLNVNQALFDLLVAFDDSVFLFFLDTRPLIARTQNFIYPAGTEVPALHTFCFWWNWGNIALLAFVLLFISWPLLLLGQWLLAGILFVVNAVWAALDIRARVRAIQTVSVLGETTATATTNASLLRGVIGRLRAAVTPGGGGVAAVQAVASPYEPRRQALIPGPDESHKAFRERVVATTRAVKAADHDSDAAAGSNSDGDSDGDAAAATSSSSSSSDGDDDADNGIEKVGAPVAYSRHRRSENSSSSKVVVPIAHSRRRNGRRSQRGPAEAARSGDIPATGPTPEVTRRRVISLHNANISDFKPAHFTKPGSE